MRLSVFANLWAVTWIWRKYKILDLVSYNCVNFKNKFKVQSIFKDLTFESINNK